MVFGLDDYARVFLLILKRVPVGLVSIKFRLNFFLLDIVGVVLEPHLNPALPLLY